MYNVDHGYMSVVKSKRIICLNLEHQDLKRFLLTGGQTRVAGGTCNPHSQCKRIVYLKVMKKGGSVQLGRSRSHRGTRLHQRVRLISAKEYFFGERSQVLNLIQE